MARDTGGGGGGGDGGDRGLGARDGEQEDATARESPGPKPAGLPLSVMGRGIRAQGHSVSKVFAGGVQPRGPGSRPGMVFTVREVHLFFFFFLSLILKYYVLACQVLPRCRDEKLDEQASFLNPGDCAGFYEQPPFNSLGSISSRAGVFFFVRRGSPERAGDGKIGGLTASLFCRAVSSSDGGRQTYSQQRVE